MRMVGAAFSPFREGSRYYRLVDFVFLCVCRRVAIIQD